MDMYAKNVLEEMKLITKASTKKDMYAYNTYCLGKFKNCKH